MAYDKVKKRHFVYYNQVIKPALVGLTGPWISGGIEFNWPQHHRPSTYLPTDCMIEENADGSKTVWCNEVERMFNTKGMQGFTLHPDKAYLEINVKVYNRTPFCRCCERPLPLGFSTRCTCCFRSWKKRCIQFSHSYRHILQTGLFGRCRYFQI